MVGNEVVKGISGGQKKRLTTGILWFLYLPLLEYMYNKGIGKGNARYVVFSGELLVGPARVLFMDEISNGLDSSSTYEIVKYLRQSTHALDETTVISLLQPAPETFELFDDIILICEGQVVYQGPRNSALDFFAIMGFRCPDRKNIADFLQEVNFDISFSIQWPLKPEAHILFTISL